MLCYVSVSVHVHDCHWRVRVFCVGQVELTRYCRFSLLTTVRHSTPNFLTPAVSTWISPRSCPMSSASETWTMTLADGKLMEQSMSIVFALFKAFVRILSMFSVLLYAWPVLCMRICACDCTCLCTCVCLIYVDVSMRVCGL